MCVFSSEFMKIKKMRDVRKIIFAAVSRRDLCNVSENKGFRFTLVVTLDGITQEKKYQAGWDPWYYKCALFMG